MTSYVVPFLRAIRLRCPHCGDRSIRVHWLRMRDRCPNCQIAIERGERDHFLGAMMFNLIAAEGLFVGVMLLAIIGTWPNPPWTLLMVGGAVLMLAAPFALYPFSKTVWLAFDLTFRPQHADDAEFIERIEPPQPTA